MAKIKANEALVKALQAWDIDHLWGIPGDSVDAVVDNLRTVRAVSYTHLTLPTILLV